MFRTLRDRLSERRPRPLEVAILATVLAGLVVVATASGLLRSDAPDDGAAKRIAGEEIKRLRGLGWERLLMTAAPARSTDPDNPFSGLSGDGERVYAPPRSPAEPLAMTDDPSRDPDYITPQPGEWTEGEQWGRVFRFVTWTRERRAKRVTVAVTTDGPAGEGPYETVYRTLVVEDPDAPAQESPAAESGPGAEVPDGAPRITLYPYDTPAGAGRRRNPSGDHAVHNTESRPDLLGEDQPPNPFEAPEAPPRFNYSTDVGGGVAGGRVIQRARSGCDGGGPAQVQRWATAPLGQASELTGNATASLWTQTADGSAGSAKICIGVYDADIDDYGIVVGQPKLLGSIWHELGSWPSRPQRVDIDFRFLEEGYHREVQAGHSIVLQLTVDAGSAADLAVLYDHPELASVFQLERTEQP